MIFRTDEQKRDLVRSWHRSDRAFFAAGACHVLAGAFLEAHPNRGFHPLLILPEPGLRGSHVFVSDGNTVFDYHGFSEQGCYLTHYFNKIGRLFSGWRGKLVRLKDSPISASFCRAHNHRLPGQYLHDPLPRARLYIARFPFGVSGKEYQ